RQSKRLKKLLDDLMEVSKATTGNLEVQLERCEVGVLLTQAAGEYEKRFEEKALELITDQPEKPVYIQADGRRLWRVFDNLLNNICKYAQENSRVYLSLEQREGQAYVIFRNMSKYALNIPAQELEERFVRGDKSRHMEGNGLGLSIAKSLVELQNGKMEIVTDGDLFKVILTFPVE
ncbi:MAG: sensor histidine kinase, partial [Acetatifactor sp.]